MPFDRNGIWTIPTDADRTAFKMQLMSKNSEVPVTPEMLEAISNNLSKEITTKHSNIDVFGAIGNLKGPVDIIIPIYDGLHVLKPCIESIIKYTNWKYKLILVNDCSPDPEISKYLVSLSTENPYPNLHFQILNNKRNRGFASSVNRGVAAGVNPYICILNSDTLVTKDWMVKQLIALEENPRNVIVNPTTNNAALINVPMYNGCSYIDMSDALSIAPNTPTYTEIMPTGFCFTIRRKLWDEIGPFDEAYISYGEETDFWFKAINQTDSKGVLLQNKGVIADNVYVYHERGTSFSQLSDEQHMSLRRSGSERFNQIHKDFASWRQGFNENNAVNHLRRELPQSAFRKQYKGNIAWVVKSAAPCGGMNFIVDIVNQLIEEGYNAKVCIIPEKYDEENPPNLQVAGNLRTAPILFKTPKEFTSTFTQRVFSKGKVLAAVTELTPFVWDLDRTYKGIEGYNHVQSYDLDLAETEGREELKEAFMESYRRLPNIVSSNWIANKLRDKGCIVEGVILPGINPDLFHPRNRENGDERFTIAILINQKYHFKGSAWAYNFLKELAPEKNTDLRVLAIGPHAIKDMRGITCLGNLTSTKMANILGTEVDVLIDPSEVHSYGLPALEALCSGCAVISRENKGIHEYEQLWKDRVIIEDSPYKAAEAINTLRTKKWKREIIENKNSNRHLNVKKFIDLVFPKSTAKKHNIEVVSPHFRKHGGPTTLISIAHQLKALEHNVDMSMIYTDWNPEVLAMAKHINIRTSYENIPKETELVIINSDNPFAGQIIQKFPDKKYIMLKLSHNPRFKMIENDNLNLPWNHIITSTEWLKKACITPMTEANWNHRNWPEDKVTVVGWYHYGHNIFNMPPTNKAYGSAKVGFRLGTLIHGHRLKGTAEAMSVIDALKRKYEANFHAVGFGEGKAKLPSYMQYVRSATRKEMAYVLKQLDIWFGASHSEGLGRMALEAMSAGVVVVTTDTGAEFLKDRENCLLYEIGNPAAGAKLVDEVMNDQELFSKLVVNGHATATAAADPGRLRHNLSKVIEEVLK